MNYIKVILIIFGTLSLCIGIIGILVPGIPTTPFVLLTAGLYLKSSDRLYQRLISNRYIGPYILEFQKNKGLTRKTKLYAISVMWFMIIISCLFFIEQLSLILLVSGVGFVGTLVMGFLLPTVDIPDNRSKKINLVKGSLKRDSSPDKTDSGHSRSTSG
jgi:uncharacterized protein